MPFNTQCKTTSVHFCTIQALTHALFNLLSLPEYLQFLQEEAEETIRREGWTKSAVDQMYKIDSFIKESQRLHLIGHCQSFILCPKFTD